MLVLVARTLDAHDHLAGSLRETRERCEGHGASVEVVVADLSDEASRGAVIPAAMERFGGRIDVLVNNAAAAIYTDITTFPLRRRRIVFEVNVHCPLDLMQAVTPSMTERGEGWIVKVSSAGARYEEGRRRPTGEPLPDSVRTHIGIYAASKAALNRLTVAYASALAGSGVRVNTVEPRAAVMSEGSVALLGDDLDGRAVSLAARSGLEQAAGQVIVHVERARDQDQRRALGGKTLGERRADPSTRAGDDDVPSTEPLHAANLSAAAGAGQRA